jgi:hypothetical protein
MSRIPSEDFEALLVRTQLVSPQQLALAKREAEVRRRRLAPMLVELGIVNEARFAEWMSQMTSIPLVDPIPPAAVEPLVRRLPRAIAREYEVVPIFMDPGRLTVATMNPLDAGCIDVLHATTAMNIRPVIGLHSAITALLVRFYPEDKSESTSQTIALPTGDDSLGSTTRVVEAAPRAESQLDRIERAIRELRTVMDSIKDRVETIEETLEHVLSRR